MISVEVFAASWLSALLLAAGALYWLLSEIRKVRTELREEMRNFRMEMREEMQNFRMEMREEFRLETQRIMEAIYYHRHDDEGAPVFYPPSPAD